MPCKLGTTMGISSINDSIIDRQRSTSVPAVFISTKVPKEIARQLEEEKQIVKAKLCTTLISILLHKQKLVKAVYIVTSKPAYVMW